MAYVVPSFPLVCNVWRRAIWPPPPFAVIPPPTLANVSCQLRSPRDVNIFEFITQATPASLLLLVPAGTDIRNPAIGSANTILWPDIVEVGSGSNCWYFLWQVFDVAKGFANEYRAGVVTPTANYDGPYHQGGGGGGPYAPVWPTPYP